MKVPGGYYIKARVIQESDISTAPPHVREIWDWLLREANHSDKNHNGKIIKRGQCVRSYKDIIDGLKWYVGYRKEAYKKANCETAMKWLKKHTMITTTKTTRGMLITILNYDKYQDPKNYETYKKPTTKPTRNLQSVDTINKNEKNDKKENNKNKDSFSFPESWPELIIEKFNEFIQHRKEIKKKLTPLAFKKQVTFLEKESGGDLNVAIEIIEQTIRNSWTGLFPLNKKQQSKTSGNMDAVKEFINGHK